MLLVSWRGRAGDSPQHRPKSRADRVQWRDLDLQLELEYLF